MDSQDGPCRNLRSKKIVSFKRKAKAISKRKIIPGKRKAAGAISETRTQCTYEKDTNGTNSEIPVVESAVCRFSLHAISSSCLQDAYTWNSDHKKDICGFQFKSDFGTFEFSCNFCKYQCSEERVFIQHLEGHIFKCDKCDFFCFSQVGLFCHQQECDNFSFDIDGFCLYTLSQMSTQTTSIDNFKVKSEIFDCDDYHHYGVSESCVGKENESPQISRVKRNCRNHLSTNVQHESEDPSCQKKTSWC